MEESNDRTSSVLSSGMNNKMNSDSGYGSNSNKSNSQSQRSSGSSKSHQSSLSSGSRSFLSHPTAPTTSTEQHGQPTTPAQASTAGAASMPRSEKDHKRKKKSKGKSSSITNFTENNQRLPSNNTTATETSQEHFKKLPGPSETASNVSVGNRAYSGGEISQQPSPDGKSGAPPDTKALQMAALTHALSCIKKFRDQDLEMNDDSEDEKMSSYSLWNEYFDSMKEELNLGTESYFGAVVSMEDGLVIHITEDLTQILGYPKGMWVGRSFMDLVHPKDKMAFASQFTFTGGITFPTGDLHLGQKGPKQTPESFFCRLRQYRGLKTTGFGVVDKTVIFFPFRLTLKLKEIEGVQKSRSSKASKSSQSEVDSENSERKGVFLFIVANRISSAYQYPEEVPLNPDKFVTRHSATCQFGHIDSIAVKYLGHLPQDVVGNSVLDYYHPDDLILLKDIYEGVMAEHGKPFKSKPYRFRVYNGTFAMLETDWSCFINPWSWKLEFVIGQHKVLKGPLNPNVFMPPKQAETPHLEEGVGDVKVVQEQIKHVLGETVTRRLSDPIKQRSSRRKKDLVVLLEMLLDQIGNQESSDQSDSVGSGAFSVLERDSAMLGEISPHHDDHSSSNQSSETPPSYNQLNYRENIERFFMSHPKTSRESDECAEVGKNDGADLPSGSTDEDSKESPIDSLGSANRQSGSNSGDNNEGCEPMGEEVLASSKKCSLTEDILYRHNENMEKYLVQQHRESRGKNNSQASASQINSRFRHFEVGDKANLKRTGNLAGWASSGSSRKAHKQPHMDIRSNFRTGNPPQPQNVPSVNLWPPYSVGLTPAAVTATYTNSFDTPVPVTLPGIAIPSYQYLQTGANPPVPLVERPQPNSFVCFPNQLRQYVPQQVSYTIPGAANMMYHSIGTPSVYGQAPQLFGQSLASQQIMMGPGGTSVLPGGTMIHPAHVLPTVPGAIRPMGVGPGVSIGVGIGMGTPIPIRPNFGAAPNGISQMPLNAIHGVPPISLASIPNSVSSSMSCSSTYPSCSTSSAPSVSTSSSGISISVSTSGASPTATKSTNSSGFQMPSKVSSSPGQEVAKIINDAMLTNQRKLNSNDKSFDFRDFSSSDGFGSSSSGSLYSLPKNERCSDENSNSPCVSQEGKDFSGSLKFLSNSDADGDQDMIWENHAEKKGKEQAKLKSGGNCVLSGIGKAKLNKKPPWLQNIDMTNEMSFRYQIPEGDLSEILQQDLNKMKIFGNQPSLVDEQLGQLYKEFELEGVTAQLNLEEGSSRYSSSYHTEDSEEDNKKDPEKDELEVSEKEKNEFNGKTKITRSDYDKIVQVYEENCPFPRREFETKILEV